MGSQRSLFRQLLQQRAAGIPQLLAQVNVVAVGVLEALDLVPEGIDLLGAVFFDLLDAGTLVDELAFLVDGHEQLARFEVIDFLTLPRGVGVEDLKIPAVVHGLVVDRQIVGNGLAGVTAIEAVELLEVRCRDLADVLADLDLGDDVSVLILHRDELVDAAEDRLALGGDETLANAEGVGLLSAGDSKVRCT